MSDACLPQTEAVSFCFIFIIYFLSFLAGTTRVFPRFYSASFKLTSARFQTFAYNARTVRSSYIRSFDSSLRLMSCMFASNFEAISHVTLVLGPENGISMANNISHGYVS